MSETPTAVAWSLHATSTSGGKRYAIIWFERYVLVGWGAVKGTMQYKMEVCATPADAQAFALAQTTGKEKRGYTMHNWPTQSHMSATQWRDALSQWVGHRGSSPGLDNMFKGIFKNGSLLSS